MAQPSAPQGEQSSAGFLLIFAVVVHVLEFSFGRLTLSGAQSSGVASLFVVLYLALAFIAAFTVFKKSDWHAQLRALAEALGISALAFFLPVIINRALGSYPNAFALSISSVALVFFPTWIFYLVFRYPELLSLGQQKFFRRYMIGWMMILLFTVVPTILQANEIVAAGSTPVISPWEATKFVGTKIKDTAVQLKIIAVNETKAQINYATGDAFTARVDKNAKEQLGITIDSLQQTQPVFTVSDPVGVYTRLTAKTLDEPLKITVTCGAEGVADSAIKSFSPKGEQTVFAEEVLDIDCEFQPGTFKDSTANIKINADFTMKTFAYLKTYFMERARLTELRTAKIDPFQQYGITDRNPVTTYTSGPVSIAMGFNAPPIGIDTEANEFTGTLGISLTNVWTGQLQKIDKIYLLMPRGFEVVELSGLAGSFVKATCVDIAPLSDWCDDAVANLFIVTPTANPVAAQQSVTLRARIRATRADYETLLGTTPISTKYFKAAADYTYRLSSQRVVQIQKTTGTGSITSEKTVVQGTPTITPSATEAVVSYTMNVASPAEIRLCQGSTMTCTDYKLFYDSTSSTTHTHTLTNLQPNTLYTFDIYGISSACSNNRCKQDSTYNFITAP